MSSSEVEKLLNIKLDLTAFNETIYVRLINGKYVHDKTPPRDTSKMTRSQLSDEIVRSRREQEKSTKRVDVGVTAFAYFRNGSTLKLDPKFGDVDKLLVRFREDVLFELSINYKGANTPEWAEETELSDFLTEKWNLSKATWDNKGYATSYNCQGFQIEANLFAYNSPTVTLLNTDVSNSLPDIALANYNKSVSKKRKEFKLSR